MFSNYQYCTWYRLVSPPEQVRLQKLSLQKQFTVVKNTLAATARTISMVPNSLKKLGQTATRTNHARVILPLTHLANIMPTSITTVYFWNALHPADITQIRVMSLQDFAVFLRVFDYSPLIPTAVTSTPGVSHQAQKFVYPRQRQTYNLVKAYQDHLLLQQELKHSGISPKIIRHPVRQQKSFDQLQEADPEGSYVRSSRCWKDQTKKQHQYSD